MNTNQKMIKSKLGLLALAKNFENISNACKKLWAIVEIAIIDLRNYTRREES